MFFLFAEVQVATDSLKQGLGEIVFKIRWRSHLKRIFTKAENLLRRVPWSEETVDTTFATIKKIYYDPIYFSMERCLDRLTVSNAVCILYVCEMLCGCERIEVVIE